MKKLNLGFNGYTDADLQVKAGTIKESMTGNAHFPGTPPELTAMVVLLAAYTQALLQAHEGSKADKALKKEKKKQLAAALTVLGNYVMTVAAGNVAILATSGFDIRRGNAPLPPLTGIFLKWLTDGQAPGQLAMAIKRVKGARLYEYQYTLDPFAENSQWTSESSTLSKHTFKGLQSGKKYWCRVVAKGTNGQVVYSEPVARIVQ